MGHERSDGVRLGEVYKLTEEETKRHRISHVDEKRVKAGDLLLVIRKSGDCFFDHLLLDKSEDSIYSIREKEPVGSYTLGVLHEEQPDSVERQLLLRGSPTSFSTKIDVEKARQERQQRIDRELDGIVDNAVRRMSQER